jgi:hypothetical protein
VICSLMTPSASIRDSIWAGPNTVVSAGNRYTRVVPYTPGSMRAATHEIMFERLRGTIGCRSRNSACGSPGIRITT